MTIKLELHPYNGWMCTDTADIYKMRALFCGYVFNSIFGTEAEGVAEGVLLVTSTPHKGSTKVVIVDSSHVEVKGQYLYVVSNVQDLILKHKLVGKRVYVTYTPYENANTTSH